MQDSYHHALIIGTGTGLSAPLARMFHANGLRFSLAARTPDKLESLATETTAAVHRCDSADHGEVVSLFEALDAGGAPDVVVYNPSARVMGPTVDLDLARCRTLYR